MVAIAMGALSYLRKSTPSACSMSLPKELTDTS